MSEASRPGGRGASEASRPGGRGASEASHETPHETRPRRTQAERRESTRAKLVEATISAIAELGYHRASLGEICARSGISKGGLFRHFDSRTDLVVAAAEEVGRRHMAAFAALREAMPMVTIEDQLRFARGQVRSDDNAVWFELLVAARTEPELRERLAPVARELYDLIEQATAEAHGGAGVDDATIRLAVTSLIHLLDGEAIMSLTYPRPELEEERLVQTANLYAALLAGRLRP